jgi:hypothetical protein
VRTLLGRDIHQFFVAYLHLRRLAGRLGRITDLEPNWAQLGTLLEVPGGPEGKPYLRPFWKGARDAHQEWLNRNLAGSFSPSSLRGVPARVVETDASGRYSLREDHWRLAREHLLFERPVPVLSLAAFLFRDFGLRSDHKPGPEDLISLFRVQYSYTPNDDAEFAHLFDTKWRGGDGPWSEPLDDLGVVVGDRG